MTLKEAWETHRLFKRKHWDLWYNKLEEKDSIQAIYENNDSYDSRKLSLLDILADDWEIEERWYEGDFKKKYPNGVLCYIGQNGNIHKPIIITIITDYVEGDDRPFKSYYDNCSNLEFGYAKPVEPDKAPAIIGGK